MIDCDRLSDRMPAVARGTERWTAEEERHLAGCEACRLEWRLVCAAGRLGADPALAVDAAAVADAVVGRLRGPLATPAPAPAPAGAVRRRTWALGGLAAAASIAVLVWTSTTPDRSPEPTARLELSVPELDDLGMEELQMIVDSLDRPFDPDDLTASPGWGELDGRDFTRGLTTSEG